MTTTQEASLRLETGDRLTREEFHRRYELRPDIKKAELIDGVVYVMPSPVSVPHGEPHAATMAWLGTYAASRSGLRLFDNITVFLTGGHEIQPDACMIRTDTPDQVRVNAQGYLEGTPLFVAEVAASSAGYDLHAKKDAYARAGVAEYLVWQTRQQRIDWFALDAGVYALLATSQSGIVESRVLSGLRLDVAAMLAGNLAAVLTAQRRSRRRRRRAANASGHEAAPG